MTDKPLREQSKEELVRLVERMAVEAQSIREEAALAEHKSHIDFENELYATLIDPVTDGPIKEAEMRKQLLDAARKQRQWAQDVYDSITYFQIEGAARRGLFEWREKHAKWWKRIDGTPIPNDLIVCIAEKVSQFLVNNLSDEALLGKMGAP